MKDEKMGTALPVDVSSRVAALLDLVNQVRRRVSASPVLSNLLSDFQEMTREYIMRFESQLSAEGRLEYREKWLRRHEMLDKLTREWHVIYSLASATELGSSFLEGLEDYVDQAVEDIGLGGPKDNFLLIPTFGEGFSLATVRYSTNNVVILKLPISVIHSPWELSVIWHEMAGLKVIRLRHQITTFLDDYAKVNNIIVPDNRPRTGSDPITELFKRITDDTQLDADFLLKVKEFLSARDAPGFRPDEIWSQNWFEQLYEDACSVFAFGDVFVPVLEKILGRQARKLTADRKYPDLETRLEVARRLLALRKGDAPPPETAAERLTDNLLWAFIQEKSSDDIARLPIAFSKTEDVPEVRRQLISDMQDFNEKFGDLSGGINEEPLDFGAMADIEKPASEDVKRAVISAADRPTQVRKKLDEIFGDADFHGLLDRPFSPSDEVNFTEHSGTEVWETMYVGSSNHGGHYVYHFGH